MPSFATALELWKRGKPQDALTEAKALAATAPNCIDLLNLLGELYVALNDPRAAAENFRRVTVLNSLDATAYRRLAGAECDAGLQSEAIHDYRRAIHLEPSNVRAHNNLGRLFEQTGDLASAASCYRTAITLDDTYAIAHINLGNVHSRELALSDALVCYQRAIALRPDMGQAWLGCATVLLSMKRAVEALPCSERAVSLLPMLADAWFVRSGVLNDLKRPEEAIGCCERALVLRHDYPEAIYARAHLLRRVGDHRGAVRGFREALRLKPDYEAARMAAVIAEIPVLSRAAAEVAAADTAFETALADLDAQLELRPCADPTRLVGALQPFYLAYQERDHSKVLGSYGHLCTRLMGSWQRSASVYRAPKQASTPSKLRIGLVSAHIINHPVYIAISRGWLQRLDRRRFVVDVFHLGHETDLETDSARLIAEHFEHGPRSIKEWVSAIIDRSPDVLIYPEVGMDQTTLQLASMRLARTQVASWGHPMTTGLPTIDQYLSAEAYEPADCADHYTEQLVRLPNLGVYYEPTPHAIELPTAVASIGIRGAVFVCAGTPFKYSSEHDRVFVDIAKRIGRCQFHFFSYEDGALSRQLLRRLHRAFSAAGLDGNSYLILRPWVSNPEFHQFLRSADVLLDTLGFSGFNTVIQALECGLPVVAYRGRFMRGRLGSGILETLMLGEFVADSPRTYVDIAVSLAESSATRTRVRDQLRIHLPTLYRDQESIDVMQEFLLGVAGA